MWQGTSFLWSNFMNDWHPMVILPNTSVRHPIAMKHIALMPPTDPIVQNAAKIQPRFGKFLNRFTDAFGEKITPSVVMVRSDAPEQVRTPSAIAGFRDAISISTTTRARAGRLIGHTGLQRPIWAECFSIYPWMLDKFGESLLANTPSLMGSHDVERFRGQSVPGFSTADIDQFDVDKPLFEKLSNRWSSRFLGDAIDWEQRAIFRSLNMAHQASMMPGGQEATFYDVGRLITLWVSAMEILIHTGPGGGAYKTGVMDLLDRAPWQDGRLEELTHPVPQKKRTIQNRSLASSLYFRIDGLRSDFVHGNDVSDEQLVTESGTPLLHVAASLYRMALATKIGVLRPNRKDEGEFDLDKFLEDFSAYSDWREPQMRHEKVVLKAMGLPEDAFVDPLDAAVAAMATDE